MKYHIHTDLLISELKKGCLCPMCRIEKMLEENYLHEFLNDAVMEEDIRKLVNEFFFCEKHYDMLLNRKNKLSVALQAYSHIDEIESFLTSSKNEKSAKKKADKIEKVNSSCLICAESHEHLKRYADTVAELFYKEKDFENVLKNSGGFCLKHYNMLLSRSKKAKTAKKRYYGVLSEVELKAAEGLKKDLKAFCDKHDYRNELKPLGKSANAVKDAKTFLYGEDKN